LGATLTPWGTAPSPLLNLLFEVFFFNNWRGVLPGNFAENKLHHYSNFGDIISIIIELQTNCLYTKAPSSLLHALMETVEAGIIIIICTKLEQIYDFILNTVRITILATKDLSQYYVTL